MPGTQLHERNAELFVRPRVAAREFCIPKSCFLDVDDLSRFINLVGNLCGSGDEYGEILGTGRASVVTENIVIESDLKSPHFYSH